MDSSNCTPLMIDPEAVDSRSREALSMAVVVEEDFFSDHSKLGGVARGSHAFRKNAVSLPSREPGSTTLDMT